MIDFTHWADYDELKGDDDHGDDCDADSDLRIKINWNWLVMSAYKGYRSGDSPIFTNIYQVLPILKANRLQI